MPATRSPGGLDYDDCLCVELRKFIKDRTGEDAHHKLKKRDLVKLLVRKDADPGVFRFTDLPPEMRNNVYERLLFLEPGINKCSPAVMRCSKQLHRETKEILYGAEPFPIAIISRPTPPMKCATTFSVNGAEIEEQHFRTATLRDTCDRWPQHLLQFKKLKIILKFGSNDAVHQGVTLYFDWLAMHINHNLYSLSSFLSQSTELKQIEVELIIEEEPDRPKKPDDTLYSLLWPVTLIKSSDQLHVSGVPDVVSAYIQEEAANQVASTTNLLSEGRVLYKRAETLKLTIRELNQRYTISDNLYARVYDVGTVLNARDWMTRIKHQKLESQVEELKAIFASPDVANVKHNIQQRVDRLLSFQEGI